MLFFSPCMQAAGVSDGGSPMNGAYGSQAGQYRRTCSAVAGTIDPQLRLVPIYRPHRMKALLDLSTCE
jgi:hypothetical protein